ncbi:MAG: DedA family protein [Patescibacteria group bacterium]|jgi:membrane protein DedA with SNARE-associated domain|nr:DedA family protein [Patescibacteria group bacterium]
MVTAVIHFLGQIVISMISTLGYFGVFLAMTIESVGIPLPSEIIMPFSGYLVYQGQFNFWLVGLVGALGNLAGSLLAYWIGLKGGRPLIEKYGKWILISHHDLNTAEKWFNKHGKSTVFFTRLLPIVRTFISFPAGMSEMKLSTFSLYTFAGSLPWCLALTWVGYKLGENWDTIGGYFRKFDYLIAILLIIGIIWYVRRHIKNLKKTYHIN